MNFEWDENKNRINVKKHGLNFKDVHFCFENPIMEKVDDRFEYGEKRYTALALLLGRAVNLVYTKKNETIRIISFRKANEREKKAYLQRFEET